jgi:hypothetical protein
MDRSRVLISQKVVMPSSFFLPRMAENIKRNYLVLPYPTYPLVDSHPYFPVLL